MAETKPVTDAEFITALLMELDATAKGRYGKFSREAENAAAVIRKLQASSSLRMSAEKAVIVADLTVALRRALRAAALPYREK